MFEFILMFIFFALLLSLGIGVVFYIFRSLGLYTIAKRRGISNPWLAWIPVANGWMLGCISDQYQYVAKGKVKNKRKVLLTLQIVYFVLYCVYYCVVIPEFMDAFIELMQTGASMEHVMSELMGFTSGAATISPFLSGISIAVTVIQYFALYDLYQSCNPDNSVLFLILSILISVTMPFLIFASRKMDLGMPPRHPQYQQPCHPNYQPPHEQWEQ